MLRPGTLLAAESAALSPEAWPLAELGAMGSGVSAGLTLLSLFQEPSRRGCRITPTPEDPA